MDVELSKTSMMSIAYLIIMLSWWLLDFEKSSFCIPCLILFKFVLVITILYNNKKTT